jgi:uncharacterized membrane protein YukC
MSDIKNIIQDTDTAINTDDTPEATNTRPILTYVAIGVIIIVIVVLVFYAYTTFTSPVEDKEEKVPMADEVITDFNLRDAIQKLQATQARVMNSLSDVSNI